MYAPGDKIIYGNSGVCTVVEVCTPNFSKAEWGKKYYKIQPIYSSETIYAPVDTKTFMRPVMTKEEAHELIARIPEIEGQSHSSSSITMLRQKYDEYFRDHDCESYVQLVKGIYSKGESGKKLGQTDHRYMKRAEEVLYNELAVALDINPSQVPEYIKSILG